MQKLYENIKYYRKLNHMTQDELAKRAGYTDRSSIAKIERGDVDLSQSKILQFAEIFGIAAGDLVGWEEATDEEKENSEAIADLAARMMVDNDFLSIVLEISKLDESRLHDVRDMLKLMLK